MCFLVLLGQKQLLVIESQWPGGCEVGLASLGTGRRLGSLVKIQCPTFDLSQGVGSDTESVPWRPCFG